MNEHSRESDRRFIAFDLEGPLSPNDNAYDLMGLFEGGKKIFESLSLYDDQLSLENRKGYEAGDTLKLILPFLIIHGISRNHIEELAKKAPLNRGAIRLVGKLREEGWQVFCITTAYEPYAMILAERLGIERENVAATRFPALDIMLSEEERSLTEGVEQAILQHEDKSTLKSILDTFFWQDLSKTEIARAMEVTIPVGGMRKVEAIERFSQSHQQPLSKWAFAGDSITDSRLLERLRAENGLAIAFNANRYALSSATVALASTDIGDLLPVLESWQKGGLNMVRETIAAMEEKATPSKYCWLPGGEPSGVLELHQTVRLKVRQEAGRLG